MANIEVEVASLEQRVAEQLEASRQTQGLDQLVSSLSALLNFEGSAKSNTRRLQQFRLAFKSTSEVLDDVSRLIDNYAERKAKSVVESSRRKDLELKKIASRVKSAEASAQQTNKPKEAVVKEFQELLNQESQSVLNYVVERLQEIQGGLKTLIQDEQSNLQARLKSEQDKLQEALDDMKHFEEVQGTRLDRVKPKSAKGAINRDQLKQEILQKAQGRLNSAAQDLKSKTRARLEVLSKRFESQVFEVRNQIEEAEALIAQRKPEATSQEEALKAANESTRLTINHMSSFTSKSLESLKQQGAELQVDLSAEGADLKACEPRLKYLKATLDKFSIRAQSTCYLIEGSLKANTELFNKLNRSSPDRSISAELPKIKRLTEEYQLVKQAIQDQLSRLTAYFDQLAGYFPKSTVATPVPASAMAPKAIVASDDEDFDEGGLGSEDFSDEDFD